MMKGLTLGLTIAAVVIVIVGVSLAIFFTVFFKQMKTSGVERIQERFPTEQIILKETTANFFGLESRGSFQIRGNGVLVLTQDELWFSRFIKREDITIPTNTIQAVRLVDSHLGKRILGRQLIYVQFQGAGGLDSAAWLVADPNRWQSAIASLLETQ
ncbi:hypothetical protein [Planktothricoides raciborskii]|jgi:hypothetical protein|uniref:GRAM domain-containing protein n=1 Tax=Planktothricoides raciborskii FACHB-1370 TaxID=2949576 RepID=A0ABR8ECY1_9CYAN|nr:hypothetical protein [Planktothricoides raciborskii]MBD2544623.1 hypothetical protein [Planktothricoides raciborskii FACHB-1370]MBD2583568.1 hypothetical protein [Planktothricoides raciborskii FACHB-1261]